jgi:hypothetical protein
VSDHARALRCRKPYITKFFTNEGHTDAGTVIYSSQATRRALNTDESAYCGLKRGQYASCQFAETTSCYDQNRLTIDLDRTTIDWSQPLGTIWRSVLVKRYPHLFEGNGNAELTYLCDPRPPGAERG